MNERAWLEKFEKNVEQVTDESTREQVLQGSQAAGQDLIHRAKFAAVALDRLETAVGEPAAAQVMEACACDCQIHAEKARGLYEKAGKDMDAFIKLLIRDTAVFGTMEREGDILNVIYPRCICWAKFAAGRISSTFCHCGNGYVKQLFEGALERPVQVDLVKSIAAGDEECRFAVHLEA